MQTVSNEAKVVLAAYQQNKQSLQFVTDKNCILEIVKKNGLALQHVADKFKADKDVVLAAYRQNWLALEYISKDIHDKAIILEIVTAITTIRSGLNNDAHAKQMLAAITYIVELIQNKKLSITDLPEDLRNNKLIAIAACQHDDKFLKYLMDRKVILALVKQNGLALQHVNDKFKADKDVVLAAYKQNWLALKYISQDIHAKAIIPEIVQDIATRSGLTNNANSKQVLAATTYIVELIQNRKLLITDLPENLHNHPVITRASTIVTCYLILESVQPSIDNIQTTWASIQTTQATTPIQNSIMLTYVKAMDAAKTAFCASECSNITTSLTNYNNACLKAIDEAITAPNGPAQYSKIMDCFRRLASAIVSIIEKFFSHKEFTTEKYASYEKKQSNTFFQSRQAIAQQLTTHMDTAKQQSSK